MKYILKFTPEIILLIYLFFFFEFKDPYREWDRIINSDGKGYYAYLPAIFIYHDMQFKFVEHYEAKYYPSNRSVFKEFRNKIGERNVDKYFPGMAIIWLPFFLFGHLLAYLEVYPMDGYSLPYQFAIAISALFFLWLGARLLKKLLSLFGADDRTAAFITLTICLGTNLIFFSIVEASMTHVYSFTLIIGFCFTVYKFFHDYQPKWFVRSLLLFTLIFLIRPTNGLILLLVPFLAGNLKIFSASFRKVFHDKITLLWGFIPSLILLSIPFILWKIQTGNWFVYSYGQEKLDFSQPNMLSILFSYNRGWFVYTPIAFISLFGFIGVLKQNKFRFLCLLIFLLAFIYTVSCWWVWYYASKCGQRIFADIYVVVALLLLFLFQSIRQKIWRKTLSVFIILLIGLNLLQHYQQTRWIFPPSIITGQIFWDSFFSLHQKARVYLPAEGITEKKSYQTGLEDDEGWMNSTTRNNSFSYHGVWSSKIDQQYPFGIGMETGIDSMFVTDNRIVLISGWIFTPKERTESSLVVDFQAGGVSKSYNPFYLEHFAIVDKWTYFESAFYVPRNLPEKSSVKIYFFDPSPFIPLFIDDLKIDFISLKDEPDYKKIEGVILPFQNP